jgi:Kef-type K+ transport system membrane component KefB
MSRLVLLLVQLAVILATARGFGRLFRSIRQPAVVGEMVAGIVLGPSVFGYLMASQHAALFPDSSRGPLTVVAQAGVILFMFVVGTRVELDLVRRHSHAVIAIAAAGIVVPFVLGGGLAILLYDAFAAPSIPRLPFILFLATAMSVTAFPVLARIITDRRLTGTIPGDTALVCAAINDAVAWILVASVVGVVAGGDTSVSLGVHAVFAAFVTGVVCAAVLPGVVPVAAFLERYGSMGLLPVFFALTGLRTDLRPLGADGASWMWSVAIILVATAGKLGATALAALLAGMPRYEALALGALMNTRGLMELVVLNIGYELGLLPPAVFAMMVVMTLVTTCAAGPLLDWWKVSYRKSSAVFAP